jgi:competence protein ComEC
LQLLELFVVQAELVPGGHSWLPSPPPSWIVTFYLLLATHLLINNLSIRHRMITAALLLTWIATGILVIVQPPSRLWLPAKLDCTFIAVGHGTCVLIQTPSGSAWLYDAGCLGNPDAAARRISAVLWSRGIWQLDGVFLSHADADHYNGLPILLERFDIAEVIVSPGMFQQAAPALQDLHDALLSCGTQLRTVAAGD